MTTVTTVILCGGKGTRAYPHTVELPKPLLVVGDTPILRHVMDIYAAQGFTSFLLAAGFGLDAIESFAQSVPSDWNVRVVDTGEETNTGGRVWRCRDHLSGTFFLTYGDGVGNVDLHALLRYHRSHPGTATVTIVPLRSQYGTIEVADDGRVQRFVEKPLLTDHWINAGFFVMEPDVFDDWPGEDLEREVLPAFGEDGRLYGFHHEGFWKSMDTYKDSLALSVLYEEGMRTLERPPWLTFETHEYS